MILTTEQRAIIIEICESQEASFIRIMERKVEQLYNELQDEGYEVSPSDIAETIAKEMMEWARVKENPEQFLQLLESNNIGLIKHYLIQDYYGKQGTPGIWKKLNLFDAVNERPN